MTEHTPGPWFPHWQGHQEHYEIRDSDEDQDGNLIAESYLQGQNRYGVTEANARLIAAAPDLLAALEEYVDWHEANFALPSGNMEDPDQMNLVKAARATIAKARGRAK